jgi:mannose-1-phosphate guanylyltransferase
MAGGSGERFWPLSRKLRPKQLLRLTDPNRTMLQEAVDRVAPLVGLENVFIATAGHLTDPIKEAGIVPAENILAEPDKRNTLGCLTWVAASLLARFGDSALDSAMTVLTADHKISEPEVFRSNLSAAIETARASGALGTLGIPPTRPETGYGYIETGTADFNVTSFREKPDLATAESFLAAGNYFWNSGMFIWTLGGFMNELAVASPESHSATLAMRLSLENDDATAAAEHFRTLPNLSIDYALMEKAAHVFMVKADFPWDDVGSFDSLLRTMPVDGAGNVVLGNVIAEDCEGCVLYNESDAAVLTAVGLREMILIQTNDAILSAPLSDAQRVKAIVGRLSESIYL